MRHPALPRPAAHIGIGGTHARTHVLLLITDRDIRTVNATTGDLLRELVLDLTHDYQPIGQPPSPNKHKPRTQ